MTAAAFITADRDTVRRVRDALTRHGAAIVGGLDPATPDAMLELAAAIGNPDPCIDEALLGPRVMHVRYDAKKTPVPGRPAYFTADAFPLHTDVSYVPRPPRYLLMHCVTPDPAGGGATLLADCHEAEFMLNTAERDCLAHRVFRFDFPPGCPAGTGGPYPVHERGKWRFKPDAMRYPDSAATAVQRFHAALRSVAIEARLQRGDLLVVDNHRVAHGREPFQPQPATAQARHLLRTYAGD